MDPVTVIVGAVVSVVVQGIKKYAGTTGLKTGVSLVVLSLISGFGLFYAKQYGFLDSALQVLVYAGATYGLIVKNLREAL